MKEREKRKKVITYTEEEEEEVSSTQWKKKIDIRNAQHSQNNNNRIQYPVRGISLLSHLFFCV